MINERIRQLIDKECKGNKRAFAQRVGISPSSIENVVGTRGGKPSFDLLEKILSSFENLDANWLILGEERHQILEKHSMPPNPEILSRMLDEINNLHERIADQAKAIGILETENKYLKNIITPAGQRGVEDVGCADAG